VAADGTDNGRPLYREKYVGREEESPEDQRRTVYTSGVMAGYGGGHPDEMTSGGLRMMYVFPFSRVLSGLSFL
jgi:hypothetical protein